MTFSKKTAKNKQTRSYIAEALITLLKRKTLDEIKISEIVKKAGVSRMTYYQYYSSKLDVLDDYIVEMINDYNNDESLKDLTGQFQNYEHIRHFFVYFRQYSDFVITLHHSGLYALLIDALNKYMETQIMTKTGKNKYTLYFYGGALANVYLEWIENDMQESEDEMAELIYNSITKKRNIE